MITILHGTEWIDMPVEDAAMYFGLSWLSGDGMIAYCSPSTEERCYIDRFMVEIRK